MIIDHTRLLTLANRIVAAGGSSPAEASIVAEHLVEANLRGHDSHGVGMLVAYVRDFEAGTLKPNQSPEIVSDTRNHLGMGRARRLRPGDRAPGGRMGDRRGAQAWRRGERIAQCAPYRARRHLWRDRRASRHGGAALRQRRFGTARRCAVPRARGALPDQSGLHRHSRHGRNEPILLDFATSRVALGKVRVAHNAGKPMIDGALLDHAGQPTTDPSVMYTQPRGAVLPFGEHKGSGLALVCELLAGAIVGSTSVTSARRPSAASSTACSPSSSIRRACPRRTA